MPSLENLRRGDWEVRTLDIAIARALVVANHYARGAANTATYLHGLFPRAAFWESDAKGAAWWIPPTKTAAQALAGDGWEGVLALSRLVCEPDAPRNGASYLMAASIRQISAERWPVLVTYADSWRGHSGAIYRATGWRDAGQTEAEAVYVVRGRMIARKAGGHTRTHGEMIALGAEMVGRFRKTRFVLDRRT